MKKVLLMTVASFILAGNAISEETKQNIKITSLLPTEATISVGKIKNYGLGSINVDYNGRLTSGNSMNISVGRREDIMVEYYERDKIDGKQKRHFAFCPTDKGDVVTYNSDSKTRDIANGVFSIMAGGGESIGGLKCIAESAFKDKSARKKAQLTAIEQQNEKRAAMAPIIAENERTLTSRARGPLETKASDEEKEMVEFAREEMLKKKLDINQIKIAMKLTAAQEALLRETLKNKPIPKK